MVIVFFSKGCERVVHICWYNGRDEFEFARKFMEKHKDAWYFEIFTEKEYKSKFE